MNENNQADYHEEHSIVNNFVDWTWKEGTMKERAVVFVINCVVWYVLLSIPVVRNLLFGFLAVLIFIVMVGVGGDA